MVLSQTIEVGASLSAVSKSVALDSIHDFEFVVEDRGTNFHNDPAAAKKIGLTAQIASAMMQMAFIHEFMEKSFGSAFSHGGTVKARWVHPVYAGDTITVTGTVTATAPEDGKKRVQVEVGCANQNGVKTAVATASALFS